MLTLGLISSITRLPESCVVYKTAKNTAAPQRRGGFHYWLVKRKPFIGIMLEVLTFNSLLNLLQSDLHSQASTSLLRISPNIAY